MSRIGAISESNQSMSSGGDACHWLRPDRFRTVRFISRSPLCQRLVEVVPRLPARLPYDHAGREAARIVERRCMNEDQLGIAATLLQHGAAAAQAESAAHSIAAVGGRVEEPELTDD